MTFDYRDSGPADEVRARIKAATVEALPPSLREFILWGINGVKVRHGADTHVAVRVTGHLSDGSGNDSHGVTALTLTVGQPDDVEDSPFESQTANDDKP